MPQGKIKSMKIKEGLILPITLVICALIIGASPLFIQINKQNSIEKQAQMKITQENKVLEGEKAEEEKNNRLCDWCLEDADNEYWNYMELNGTGKRDDEKGVRASRSIWDRAREVKQQAINNCFNKYKK